MHAGVKGPLATARVSMALLSRRAAHCACLALAAAALLAPSSGAVTIGRSAGTVGVPTAALASDYIGSVPPSAADKRGLLRAFQRHHRASSHLLLVGFRECCIFSNTPGQALRSAAAYYLTAGSHASYGSAGTELYRRAHGATWVHVARFRNTTPDWNDAYNLGAGFLWRVTAHGSGAYDSRATTAATDGSFTDTYTSHVTFTWNFAFRGASFSPGSDNGLDAPHLLTGQASAGVAYSDTPEQNATCAGPVKDTSRDGSPNLSYAQVPEYGATKALDFTFQLAGGANLSWPSGCNSDWATFPDADRLLVGARMPIAVASSHGIYELGGNHVPDMHAQPFSYPVDDLANPVVGRAKPHRSSSSNDGTSVLTSTEDLKLAGTLHFRLVGLFMPLGQFGSPHPPLRDDGHGPPVL